jgi:hypothetical protein
MLNAKSRKEDRSLVWLAGARCVRFLKGNHDHDTKVCRLFLPHLFQIPINWICIIYYIGIAIGKQQVFKHQFTSGVECP